jgi:hypothetical protein
LSYASGGIESSRLSVRVFDGDEPGLKLKATKARKRE